MTIFLIGISLFGTVLGLFYLKDRHKSPALARIAHSELVMRLTVIAVILIVIGILLGLNKLFS